MPEFSYIRLGNGLAKVTCVCGWEEEPMRVSPFDPQEALAAASVEHLVCLSGKLRPMPDITANEYQKQALSTEETPAFINPAWVAHYNEKNPDNPISARMLERLLHALLGIASELGELADPVKKALIYDKPINLTNLKEEFGDLPWYNALGADAIGFPFGDVLSTNIAKLAVRFKGKFSKEKGIHRDLEAEKRALEGAQEPGEGG